MKRRSVLLAILGVVSTVAQTPEELQAFRLEYRLAFDPQSAPVLGSDLAEAILAGTREIRQQAVYDAPAKRLTIRTFSVLSGAPPITALRDALPAEIENYRVDVKSIVVEARSLAFEGAVAPEPRVFLAAVLPGDPWSMRASWYGVSSPVFHEIVLGYVGRTAYIAGGAGLFEFSRVPNRAPVAAVADAPLSVFQPELTLDASASSDPDGEAIEFTWRAIRGSVSISGADTPRPRVQFHSGPGRYELLLTVTDARGAASEAVVSTSYYGR